MTRAGRRKHTAAKRSKLKKPAAGGKKAKKEETPADTAPPPKSPPQPTKLTGKKRKLPETPKDSSDPEPITPIKKKARVRWEENLVVKRQLWSPKDYDRKPNAVTCDNCQELAFGFFFSCNDCTDFSLCPNCNTQRKKIHPVHKFTRRRFEVDDK